MGKTIFSSLQFLPSVRNEECSSYFQLLKKCLSWLNRQKTIEYKCGSSTHNFAGVFFCTHVISHGCHITRLPFRTRVRSHASHFERVPLHARVTSYACRLTRLPFVTFRTCAFPQTCYIARVPFLARIISHACCACNIARESFRHVARVYCVINLVPTLSLLFLLCRRGI